MLLVYLKLAWKMARRRKLFTAVGLLGIGFPVAVALGLAALVEAALGPYPPERHAGQLLLISELQLRYGSGDYSTGTPSYAFLRRYASPLRAAQRVSVSEYGWHPALAGPGPGTADLKRADAAFWRVLDFTFVAGRPYSPAEEQRRAQVLVLNETLARRWFGRPAAAVGRVLPLDGLPYRVVGVVRDVSLLRAASYAEAWRPIDPTRDTPASDDYRGEFQALVLVRRPAAGPLVRAEYARALRAAPAGSYRAVRSAARPLSAAVLAAVRLQAQLSGTTALPWVAAGLGALAVALPALSLVVLYRGAARERAGEMGVRQAFGATRRQLAGQFLAEHALLTLLGGAAGLLLAAGSLAMLNASRALPYTTLALTPRTAGAGFIVMVLLGALSGGWPAWQLARQPLLPGLQMAPAR